MIGRQTNIPPVQSKLLKYRCQQTIVSVYKEFGLQYAPRTYIHLDRGRPILAVAHLDTVWHHRNQLNHAMKWEEHENSGVIYSPSLDDRLGLYMILDYLPKLGMEYDILLTLDEEIGKSTASGFKPPRDYRWIFEWDRGGEDAVIYQFQTPDWIKALRTAGFKIGRGSVSDISYLGDLGCAAVNVGCGYHRAHTLQHYVDLSELYRQIKRFRVFWEQNNYTHFPYDGTEYRTCQYCGKTKPEDQFYSYNECQECADAYDTMRYSRGRDHNKRLKSWLDKYQSPAQLYSGNSVKILKPDPSGNGKWIPDEPEKPVHKCDWCETTDPRKVGDWSNYAYPNSTGGADHFTLCDKCLANAGYEHPDDVGYCWSCDQSIIWLDTNEEGEPKCPCCGQYHTVVGEHEYTRSLGKKSRKKLKDANRNSKN